MYTRMIVYALCENMVATTACHAPKLRLPPRKSCLLAFAFACLCFRFCVPLFSLLRAFVFAFACLCFCFCVPLFLLLRAFVFAFACLCFRFCVPLLRQAHVQSCHVFLVLVQRKIVRHPVLCSYIPTYTHAYIHTYTLILTLCRVFSREMRTQSRSTRDATTLSPSLSEAPARARRSQHRACLPT